MSWPNLLNIALAHLPRTKVLWHRFTGRTLDLGTYINAYDEPVEVVGSLQAVDNERVKEWGLDETREYAVFYASRPMDHVQEGTSPDKIEANGIEYAVVSNADWYAQNGWRGVLLERKR